MDPSAFRIDWEVLTEVLVSIIVLAFFIERALSLVFEHRWFVAKFRKSGFKEPIAFVVSLAIVRYWNFDALGVVFHADVATWWGYLVTAAVVAGGSKASIKLFQDLMKVKSNAVRETESKAPARK
jgi:hypothetical protein